MTQTQKEIAIFSYQNLLEQRQEIDDLIDAAKQSIFQIAEQAGQKSISAKHGSTKITVTVVSKEVTTFNEDGLKKALGSVSYKKLCKTSLDKDKLLKAISAGDVDPVVVATYSEIKQSAPYIRLTEKAEDD